MMSYCIVCMCEKYNDRYIGNVMIDHRKCFVPKNADSKIRRLQQRPHYKYGYIADTNLTPNSCHKQSTVNQVACCHSNNASCQHDGDNQSYNKLEHNRLTLMDRSSEYCKNVNVIGNSKKYLYFDTESEMSDFSRPNPCHQNQCHQNPCHQNPCHQNPCHQNPCHQNPCHQNPCHQNPCHQNPCHQNPCHQNPCHDSTSDCASECSDQPCTTAPDPCCTVCEIVIPEDCADCEGVGEMLRCLDPKDRCKNMVSLCSLNTSLKINERLKVVYMNEIVSALRLMNLTYDFLQRDGKIFRDMINQDQIDAYVVEAQQFIDDMIARKTELESTLVLIEDSPELYEATLEEIARLETEIEKYQKFIELLSPGGYFYEFLNNTLQKRRASIQYNDCPSYCELVDVNKNLDLLKTVIVELEDPGALGKGCSLSAAEKKNHKELLQRYLIVVYMLIRGLKRPSVLVTGDPDVDYENIDSYLPVGGNTVMRFPDGTPMNTTKKANDYITGYADIWATICSNINFYDNQGYVLRTYFDIPSATFPKSGLMQSTNIHNTTNLTTIYRYNTGSYTAGVDRGLYNITTNAPNPNNNAIPTSSTTSFVFKDIVDRLVRSARNSASDVSDYLDIMTITLSLADKIPTV
jgi:hypothetical protein